MKIIIVGAGKVGFTLAEHLSGEGHDITIIDKNDSAIRHASDALDVMCIRGNGASPPVLQEAGIATADFLLSTTSLDEVNMLCSLTAKRLGAKYTVARIRDVEYTAHVRSFQQELSIDMVINPEQATALEIFHLLRFPQATNIDTFFRGRVELLGTQVKEGDFILGRPLSALSSKVKQVPFLFCAAQRGDRTIIPNGSFVPQLGDKLYIIGSPQGVGQYFKLLGRYVPKVHSAFIVGGSRIAQYLAALLQQLRIHVTIVEQKPELCRSLSETLPDATILNGDGTDPEMLASEHVTNHDAFIALTGRDEDNLLISLYAKQQGLKKAVAKCNRDNYFSIVRSAGLESVVSPKLITVSRILRVVRALHNKKGGVMVALYRFADNQAEAAEFEVTKDALHLNTPLMELPLREGILLAAVLHNKRVIIPNGKTVISQGDRVIVVSRNQMLQDFNDIYRDGRGALL